MTASTPDALWCTACFQRDLGSKEFAGWGGHVTTDHYTLMLRPEERLALSVAVDRLAASADVPPHIAAVCIEALARITSQ